MQSKIDIIMATYNGEKYLEEQILSILNQTYLNFNLIVSDDASTDATVNIIKKYAKKDKRIILYQQKRNLGFNDNFSFLLSKVKSPLFMISDQDDVWQLDKIEKMVSYLYETDASLVFCDMKVVDENKKEIYPSFHKMVNKSKQCCKYHDFQLLKIENVISGSSILAKSCILKSSLPIPNWDYVYDYWLGIVALEYGDIYYLNEPLQLYRQHSQNSVGAISNKKIKPFEEYRQYLIDYKYNFYKTLKENIKLFPKNRKFIEKYYDIFSSLKRNEKGKIFNTFKFYNTESILRRFNMFLLFNYPKIAKMLYGIKYKGVTR